MKLNLQKNKMNLLMCGRRWLLPWNVARKFHGVSSPTKMKAKAKDTDHSFIPKDDIGYVCRVCGLVQKGIEDIFEFLFPQRTKTKSYRPVPPNIKDKKLVESLPHWYTSPKLDLTVTEDFPHTKHIKLMKPHQMAGFNFLLSNLVTEDPHGCILAHASGSRKSFMIICLMQSFLAKFPSDRPLVVLPKGILSTWKKEFRRWQVDDIPLYDLYSAKAGNCTRQLNVLKQWVEHKSILFLGYKQFSFIVTGTATCQSMGACQEILVKTPTVLILDKGHTLRIKTQTHWTHSQGFRHLGKLCFQAHFIRIMLRKSSTF